MTPRRHPQFSTWLKTQPKIVKEPMRIFLCTMQVQPTKPQKALWDPHRAIKCTQISKTRPVNSNKQHWWDQESRLNSLGRTLWQTVKISLIWTVTVGELPLDSSQEEFPMVVVQLLRWEFNSTVQEDLSEVHREPDLQPKRGKTVLNSLKVVVTEWTIRPMSWVLSRKSSRRDMKVRDRADS